MDHAWLIRKILTGLVILGAVIFGIVRLGAGTAAVAGLGNLPMSMVPAGLRRFLFGERNSTAHMGAEVTARLLLCSLRFARLMVA